MNIKKFFRNKKGFTLIEIVVTIAIMATLSAILVPSFVALSRESRMKKDNVEFEAVCTAIKSALAEPEVRKELEQNDKIQNQPFLVAFESDPTGKINFANGKIFLDKTDTEIKFNDLKMAKFVYQSVDKQYQIELRECYGYTLKIAVTPKQSNTTAKATYTFVGPGGGD